MKIIAEKSFAPLESKRSKIKSALTGFTLMELVIVIIIIGVLASIVYPQYIKAREQAIDESMQDTLKLIRVASRNFYFKHGNYPNLGGTAWPYMLNSVLGTDLVNGSINYYYARDAAEGFRALVWRKSGGYGRFWQIYGTWENPECVHYAGQNDWCP